MKHLVRWMFVCFVAVLFAAQAYAQCPSSVSIITPPNNGKVQRTPEGSVLLKWNAVTGATSYDVYFGAVGQGCTAQAPRATVTSPNWSPPSGDVTAGAQYEWRVVANGFQQCQTPPASSCAKFMVAPCPTAPTLTAPAHQSAQAFGAITLQWSSVANVHDYQVYIGIDGDTPSLHAVTTSNTKTINVGPGRVITWYVVARANGCQDAASAVKNFHTTCSNTPPSLQSPSRGATVTPGTPFTFTWTAVPGADGYDVEINEGQGWNPIGENLTATSFTATLPAGNYQWAVRANFDGDCDPLYSDPRDLVVAEQGCTNGGPTELLAPARSATVDAPVTFEWASRAGALEYLLYVQKSSERTPRLIATTTRTSYTAPELTGGTYEWWVVVKYGQCADQESNRRVVTISGGGSDCPASPGQATLVSPAAGATNLSSPVTFQWNAVPGATGYRVLVSYNDSEPTSIGETTSTSLTVQVPAGSGLWGVQTLFGDNCRTTLSEPRAFTVTAGTSCPTTAPQLVFPANGATVTESPVRFRWNAVSNAVSYLVFVAAGSDDFRLYGETSDTHLEAFVPAGSARWFILARFTSCEPLRSAISSFTVAGAASCPDATLTLLTPADNSTPTSPVRFSWSAVSGATAYRIWVAVDGGSPNNVARVTTTAAEVSLPAGTIVWYVEALREGCEPVISNKGRFTIAKSTACASNAAPALLSPIGSRTAPVAVGERVTLSWNPVERAIAYRVWIGRNGDGFSDTTLTRETSTEITLTDGLYGWYVEALFEACDPVASDRSFFQVFGSQQACTTAAPSTIAPAQGSTVSGDVTFSWNAVAGADKYRVYVSINGSEPKVIGSTEESSLTRSLPPGQVVWTVEAVFEKCPSTFSSRVQFTIAQAQSCTSTGTTLVSPANGVTDVALPVDFVWNPVAGAIKYVLVVKTKDGAPTPLAATTDTHFVVDKLPAGAVEWWVATYFAGCNPVDSAHSRFTVARAANCDNQKPILLIPDSTSTSPVQFQWTRVPRAVGYKVWVAQDQNRGGIIATTTETKAEAAMPEGTYEWYVEALFASCPSTESARAEFRVTPPVACGTPETPEPRVVGQALSDTEYRVRWKRLPNVGLYEVQEATSLTFANAQTFTTSDTSLTFSHQVTGTPVQYVYRVRAVSSCNDERSAYSNPVGVFVTPPRTSNASAEIGSESTIVQKVFLPGSPEPLNFVATSDKPWLTIVPSSGVLPAEGITLNVTADPTVLNLGTNTGTISVEYSAAGSGKGGPASNATSTVKLPISISLVTPVLPTGKGTPPPDALIFPVVGHAQGANDSLFESDIRVTNLTAATMKYDLNFTPSGTNGTQTGSTTTVEIGSGATLALDDVVASVFGSGTVSSATGMLEVRPLTTSSNPAGSLFPRATASLLKQLDTAASSRTYNYTPNGTFGQFIPATRFADFVGKAAPGAIAQVLSLQQVAQSAAYRANFGFAEASGASADMMLRVFDVSGALLATIPVSLGPSEHRQLNGMLAANGINDLQDGRVEVEVVGGEGKITAYVSEVDNKTNDPLLVSAVVKGSVTSNRYVVPGTAFVNSGFFFWVTDLRIFNAGSVETPATLTFYPMSNPSGAVTRDILINAGEIKVLDNVLSELFGQPNGAAGMIAISTPTETTLTATARTYNKTSNGTYGQYIPGVTPAQSVGREDRALQLLQLEQSSRFRTNVGLAETTGQPATIEVSLTVPDSLSTPVVTIPLAANEFRQFSLADFGLGAIYNARVSVKVIDGAGRVTAYGSAIDQITQDPTYVPAQ